MNNCPVCGNGQREGSEACDNGNYNGVCPATSKVMRVTSTWLRKYVIQIINAGGDPAALCANYDPDAAESVYWQCVDPATADPRTKGGLPRVFRFAWDHFRLAAHPDGLTHGFIGGSEQEHFIDMVGRRLNVHPR